MGVSDLLTLGVGDLLDKIDDGTSKLWVPNLHECFGEVEPVAPDVAGRRGIVIGGLGFFKVGQPSCKWGHASDGIRFRKA